MKLRFLLIFTVCALPCIKAQYNVEILVEDFPDYYRNDTIYLSGNFNFWAAADESYILKKDELGNYKTIVRYDELPGDRLEFKFTRGDWHKSECTADGRLTAPRTAAINQNLTIHCTIDGWRDYFPSSTASANVKVLDTAFYMPQLQRYRHIWVYLPADYNQSEKKYPVLYMQDGQHLFDEATSVGRIGPVEWSVDETLDGFSNAGIIIGINHNEDMEERISEYYYHSPDGGGTKAEGKDYLDFIVHTLKPYVDSHFRTLPDPEYTGICGSSMGGLISLYGGLHYPETFGKVAAFSPSIWMDNGNLEAEIDKLKKIGNPDYSSQKYFFYIGDNEVRQKEDKSFIDMKEDAETIKDKILTELSSNVDMLIKSGGRHGALYWRQAFPLFYKWFTLEW